MGEIGGAEGTGGVEGIVGFRGYSVGTGML